MTIARNSKTTLAIALSTGLLLVAGGALANPPAQQDRVDNQQATAAQRADNDNKVVNQDGDLTNTERLDRADSDQPVDDTWITTKVKASLLAEKNVAGTDIRVVTNDGVVALSGKVASQAQIDKAKKIAQDTKGVVRVDASDLKTSR